MLKEDFSLGFHAGRGYSVLWDGEGRDRKLVVRDVRDRMVAAPLPPVRQVYDEKTDSMRPVWTTTEDIIATIQRLVRHLEVLG